jgi:hypothetical protein
MSQRTTCQRGHDLTVAENVYRYPDGTKRQCRVCMEENPRRRRPDTGPKTHCGNGHPLTEENAYRCPQGRRYCRPCIDARNERRKAARRAARTRAGTTGGS